MQGQEQTFQGQTLSRPRAEILEAKDQGHKAEVFSTKRSSLKKRAKFPQNHTISKVQTKKSSLKIVANIPQNSGVLQNFFARSLACS